MKLGAVGAALLVAVGLGCWLTAGDGDPDDARPGIHRTQAP